EDKRAPIGQSLGWAVTHPGEAVNTLMQGIGGGAMEQYDKAATEAKAGHYPEAFGHGLAATLPLVGPAAARVGEAGAEHGLTSDEFTSKFAAIMAPELVG